MAYHQNSSVDSTKLIIGNCKIESAATSGGTYVNLGAGIVNSAVHNIVKYDVEAGNAPDPVEGVADETFTISGELIEYDGSVLSACMGGIISCTVTSVLSTVTGGGASTITERAFKLTNTRMVSGVTKETIFIAYKATFDTGPSFTFKSDNDADPVTTMPFTITGKLDSTRTAGDQLYTITKWLS